MRLDHLLSKEEVRVGLLLICQGANLLHKELGNGLCYEQDECLHSGLGNNIRRYRANGRARGVRRIPRVKGGCSTATRKQQQNSGGDALMGHTRSHPEHDG